MAFKIRSQNTLDQSKKKYIEIPKVIIEVAQSCGLPGNRSWFFGVLILSPSMGLL